MAIRQFFWRIKDYLQSTDKTPLNVIASKDGQIYEVRDHLVGRFVTRVSHIKELDEVKGGFQFNLPKIPSSLLEMTLSFFKHFCTDHEQNEVMVVIYWDRHLEIYVITCPKQEVSKGHIEAEFDEQFLFSERYVPVLHIHSHNNMRAYFSLTDNENEGRGMMCLYGVVGQLDQDIPELKFRAGSRGDYISLPIELIFENPTLNTNGFFPHEWVERVYVAGREEL